jgi:hypothetical protein
LAFWRRHTGDAFPRLRGQPARHRPHRYWSSSTMRSLSYSSVKRRTYSSVIRGICFGTQQAFSLPSQVAAAGRPICFVHQRSGIPLCSLIPSGLLRPRNAAEQLCGHFTALPLFGCVGAQVCRGSLQIVQFAACCAVRCRLCCAI